MARYYRYLLLTWVIITGTLINLVPVFSLRQNAYAANSSLTVTAVVNVTEEFALLFRRYSSFETLSSQDGVTRLRFKPAYSSTRSYKNHTAILEIYDQNSLVFRSIQKDEQGRGYIDFYISDNISGQILASVTDLSLPQVIKITKSLTIPQLYAKNNQKTHSSTTGFYWLGISALYLLPRNRKVVMLKERYVAVKEKLLFHISHGIDTSGRDYYLSSKSL